MIIFILILSLVLEYTINKYSKINGFTYSVNIFLKRKNFFCVHIMFFFFCLGELCDTYCDCHTFFKISSTSYKLKYNRHNDRKTNGELL